MKKSLFAMAAVTAFAGAAQAQSSVTVYGILDVGFAGTTSRVPSINDAAAYKTNATSFNGGGNESTSRLGFKGNEDLGGGVNAFFTAEMQLSAANSNNYINMTNRQTFVGLGKKGLGQAAIGTQYTPIHLAVGATDPGQANNIMGNAIYSVNSTTANASSTYAYTVRQNNALTFATASFAGFKLNGMYGITNSDRTQVGTDNQYTTTQATASTAGGNTNNTAWGLGADYTWNKLSASLAYQNIKNETNNSQVNITAQTSTVNTTANEVGVNVSSTQYYGAAVYDFGILKAYAQYINNKTTSTLSSAVYAKRTAQQLGVRSFVTPTIETWASVGNGRISAFGTDEPTANFTAYQLGANYYLSKRTNLYGIFGSTQTSTVNNSSTASSYDVKGAAGNSGYAVGVRHTF